jgi:hypothetical protein
MPLKVISRATGLLGATTILVFGVGACGAGSSSTPSTPVVPQHGATSIIVTEQGVQNLMVFPSTADGSVMPSTQLVFPENDRPDKGDVTPRLCTIDSSGNIWVTANLLGGGEGPNYVARYAPNASGNTAPEEMITGATLPGGVNQILQVSAVAVGTSGQIYVVNGNAVLPPGINGQILIFPAGAQNVATPVGVLEGTQTQLAGPVGIVLAGDGTLYVSNEGADSSTFDGSITVYAPGAQGNAAPTRVISGQNTGLVDPVGMALDSAGYLYVANGYFVPDQMDNNDFTLTGEVLVFAPGASGDVAPVRTISGSKTLFSKPAHGVAVDSQGWIYVTERDVLVFAPGANGDIAPSQHIVNPTSEEQSIEGWFGIALR